MMTMTLRRFLCVLLSALLLAAGWIGVSGLPLLAALVPLLWISSTYGASRRDWWRMFGWAWLAFALWNGLTIWGLWYSTPVGPFAATLASTFLNLLAFMLYHTVSKRAHKALAYTLLVSGWIATEYWYTVGEFSFPWLLFGNGFAAEPWAVQWYEYTGLFGGTLWVLLCNLFLFEAWQHRRALRYWVRAALVLLLPLVVSLTVYSCWQEPQRHLAAAVIQPNVDCYDKFNTSPDSQRENLLSLLSEVPDSVQLIAMPETALVEGINESYLSASPSVQQLVAALSADHPRALLVVGADIRLVRSQLRHALGSTQQRTNPGDQFTHFKGFCEIVIGAKLKSHHAVGKFAQGAQENQRRIFTLAPRQTQSAANGKTILTRQHEVEQDQVRRLSVKCLKKPCGVLHSMRAKTQSPEIFLKKLGNFRLILNDLNEC